MNAIDRLKEMYRKKSEEDSKASSIRAEEYTERQTKIQPLITAVEELKQASISLELDNNIRDYLSNLLMVDIGNYNTYAPSVVFDIKTIQLHYYYDHNRSNFVIKQDQIDSSFAGDHSTHSRTFSKVDDLIENLLTVIMDRIPPWDEFAIDALKKQ